jgi:small-conductance mechanosensitive channel
MLSPFNFALNAETTVATPATKEALPDTIADHVSQTGETVAENVSKASEVVGEEVKKTIFERFNFGGNALGEWFIALGIFFGSFLLFKAVVAILLSYVKKSNFIKEEGVLKRIVVASLGSISSFSLFFLALDLATLPLVLPPHLRGAASSLPMFALLWQLAIWAKPLIAIGIGHYVSSRQNEQDRSALQTLTGPLRFILLTTAWSILALIGLDNAGVNVTTLVASLGVGGIAVGLALQGILGDLFASLSIGLDKPFVIGEFIISNDFMGTVKHIGLRSTRLDSLSGEEIIIPNSDMTAARIRNYTRMDRRRVVITFGVSYHTPAEALETIPIYMTQALESIENTTLDRVNLSKFGESAVEFELVYFVESPDYNLHMALQEVLLLKVFKKFQAQGIEFAFPSRRIYVESATLGGIT